MKRFITIFTKVCFLLLALVWLVPIIWVFLSSFKTYEETIKLPIAILPKNFFNFSNYIELLGRLNFLSYYKNNIIISLGIVFPLLFFSSLAAYAFARINFFFKNAIFVSLFIALMIPIQIVLVPRYNLMLKLGWINTYMAVIIPGIPSIVGTFFIRQHILSLPLSLDESAILDGANHFQIYWFIILPLCKNALLAIGIVALVSTWNDFLWPLIVINNPEKYTLSIAVANLQGFHLTRENHIMTAALLVSFPIIVLFLVAQRYFIEGVAFSGLKE